MEHRERLESSKVEQVLAASGIAFLLVTLVPGFLLPQMPGHNTPAEQMMTSYADHYTSLLAGRYIFGLASVFLILFTGGLYSFLRRAEGGGGTFAIIAFGGGIAFAVMNLAVMAFQTAATLIAGAGGNPEMIRTLTFVSSAFGTFTAFTIAVLLTGGSVAMLRTRVMPRWIGWAGLLGAVSHIVSAANYTDSPLGLFSAIGLLITLVWILATSIVLLRRSRMQHPTTEAAAA